MSWKIFSRRRSVLEEVISKYQPYVAPFPRAARQLTLEQARENHAYLIAVSQHRISLIADALSEWDINARDYSGGAFVQLLEDVDRWAVSEWPTVFSERLAKREVWEQSNRAGGEMVFSLLMDVAILLGEMIISKASNCSWSVDLSEDSRQSGMSTYKRTVICISDRQFDPSPAYVDIEQIVVGRLRDCNFPVPLDTGLFARVVLDSIHEAGTPWREGVRLER